MPRTITFICWDVAHNAAGRAYQLADALRELYDVEILGGVHPRFGSRVWKPLEHSRVPIRTFQGLNFPAQWENLKRTVETVNGDVVYIVKPRLPGIALGALAKIQRNRPLLLDIDDYELGFFTKQTPLQVTEVNAHPRTPDFYRPFGEVWTRVCASLTPFMDSLTVSNEELQHVYGGTIVPHMRDEVDFDPTRVDREASRRDLGYTPEDRVVLFLGTPRRHKGLLEISRAVEALGDGRYKFCLIGSPTDLRTLQLTRRLRRKHVRHLPDIAFSDLPKTICAADLICLSQDPHSPVAQYQLPAKLIDALAMGIPIAATPTGPLRPLAERGLIVPFENQDARVVIKQIFENYAEHQARAQASRASFLKEFSYTANRPGIGGLIEESLAAPKPVPDPLRHLVAVLEREFTTRRHSPVTAWNILEDTFQPYVRSLLQAKVQGSVNRDT